MRGHSAQRFLRGGDEKGRCELKVSRRTNVPAWGGELLRAYMHSLMREARGRIVHSGWGWGADRPPGMGPLKWNTRD